MINSLLRALVDLRDRQIQKSRIAFDNRASAIERGSDKSDAEQKILVKRWQERFKDLEKILDKDIQAVVAKEPIYKHLSNIKGVGPMLSAKMVAMIDIHECVTPSALWRFSGYGIGKYWADKDGAIMAPQSGHKWKDIPEDEQEDDGPTKEMVRVISEAKPDWELVSGRDRLVAGWCSPFNGRLKTSLYILGGSFLKGKSPYRKVYDDAKEAYQSRDWKKAHIHLASQRKMLKVFLSHLWLYWRTIEGLEVTDPYVHAVLEHEHKYEAEDFGWPKLSTIKKKTEELSEAKA